MIRNGARFPVAMADAFPAGCALVPESITEAQDYDPQTKTRSPSEDKVTGKKVWQCRVSDLDPELAGRSREVAVKILADREPSPPTGHPFEMVEFDNLVATPWVTDKGRMAYSLRASGLKAARQQPQHQAKDAA